MNIELHDGRWVTDEYTIAGDYADGYEVFRTEDENEEPVYESMDFEKCLTWCLNS